MLGWGVSFVLLGLLLVAGARIEILQAALRACDEEH